MEYFTKEVKISIAAIVAIVLLYCCINFLKGINLFKTSSTYVVEFEDAQGLAASSPVYANGFAVGIVRSVNYDYERLGRVIVNIDLEKDMRVPVGTHAELESSLMGGVTMHLVLGADPLHSLSRQDTLKGYVRQGAMGKAEALLPEVERLLPKLDSILTSVNTLLSNPAIEKSLTNVQVLTQNLGESSSKLDGLFEKQIPEIMLQLNQIGENSVQITNNLKDLRIDTTLHEANQTIQNVEEMTRTLNNRLRSTDNSVGLLLNNRELFDNLNNTMSSANELLRDLKQHPKRYVHFSLFGKKDK